MPSALEFLQPQQSAQDFLLSTPQEEPEQSAAEFLSQPSPSPQRPISGQGEPEISFEPTAPEQSPSITETPVKIKTGAPSTKPGWEDWASGYINSFSTGMSKGFDSPEHKRQLSEFQAIDKQVAEPVFKKAGKIASWVALAVYGYEGLKAIPELWKIARGGLSKPLTPQEQFETARYLKDQGFKDEAKTISDLARRYPEIRAQLMKEVGVGTGLRQAPVLALPAPTPPITTAPIQPPAVGVAPPPAPAAPSPVAVSGATQAITGAQAVPAALPSVATPAPQPLAEAPQPGPMTATEFLTGKAEPEPVAPKAPKINLKEETVAEMLDAMDVAEKGSRLFKEADIGGPPDVSKIPSTYPSWYPSFSVKGGAETVKSVLKDIDAGVPVKGTLGTYLADRVKDRAALIKDRIFSPQGVTAGNADLQVGDKFEINAEPAEVVSRNDAEVIIKTESRTIKADPFFDKITIDGGVKGVQRAGQEGVKFKEVRIPEAEQVSKEAKKKIRVAGKVTTKQLPAGKTKKLVRNVTGQVKVSDLTDERTALRAVMKAQVRAARGAFTIGKKEGISKQKLHQQRVAEAKTLRDELKGRTNKAIVTINKLPTESLPLEYKKRLEGMKSAVDPKRRTKATLAQRASLKAFIKRQIAAGEQINIPKKTLEMMGKKSVSEMTIDEVENLADAMKQVAHIGRVKGKLLKIREGKELNSVITELSDQLQEIKGVGHIPPGKPITEATKKAYLPGKTNRAVKSFLIKNSRVERILESLDDYKDNGVNHSTVYMPIERAANKSYAGQQNKIDVVNKAIKDLNIDMHKTVSEPREINKHVGVMTGEEAMEVYLSTFDEDKFRHLVKGNRFTEKDVTDIISSLAPEEKAFVEWEIENYWKPQYDEINPIYEKLFNNSLPKIEGYSHINTEKELAEFTPYENDLSKELLGRQFIRTGLVERGFTKERKDMAAQPLNLKHFDNLWRNVEKVEHFKSFALTARDLRKIVNSLEYKRQVTRAGGADTYKVIKEWFDDVVSRKRYTATAASSMIKTMRNHSAIGMLGFNVLTGAKQTASFFTAASLVDSPSILSGMLQVAQNHKEIESFVYARSPQLKNRNVERDIQELMNEARAENIFAKKGTLSTRSMAFIKWFDQKTVLSVWKGAYDKSIKSMPEQEAIDFADKIVRRTQPAFDIKDLPAFFRGGELEKMLTMFMNQRNQNWNLFLHDIVGKTKAGRIGKLEALRRLWWIWAVPAFILGSVARGRFKATPKETALDLVKFSPIAGVFMVGPITDALISGWDWSLPAFQPIKSLGYAAKGLQAKKIKPGKVLKHTVKGVGMLAGLPVNQVFRTGEGAIDLLNKKTDDFRRLIYSEYALTGGKRQKKKKKKGVFK